MDIIIPKYLKRVIVKLVIIMMSFLYALAPAYKEINELLHIAVHTLEMPNEIISHQKKIDNKHHKNKHQKKTAFKHNHNVLNLVSTLLEKVNKDKEVPHKKGVVYKVDKHTGIQKNITYKKQPLAYVKKNKKFISKNKRLCKGFLKNIEKPPKNLSRIFV